MEFFKLARTNFLFLLLTFLFTACSVLDPYFDRKRDAGAPEDKLYVGRSKKDAPSICYNLLTTDYETVKKLADDECLKYKTGTHAVPVNQEAFSCRLLLPARINFKCEK